MGNAGGCRRGIGHGAIDGGVGYTANVRPGLGTDILAGIGDVMKSLVLGSVALIAIGVTIPAHAADLAVKAPPPPAPAAPYNWSGLYVGGVRFTPKADIGTLPRQVHAITD